MINLRFQQNSPRNPHSKPADQEGEVGGQLPITGRRSEMEYLRDTISAGRLLLIEGEPGIGKTRLVQSF
jgi:MoxR-like ATPase